MNRRRFFGAIAAAGLPVGTQAEQHIVEISLSTETVREAIREELVTLTFLSDADRESALATLGAAE